MPSKKGSRKSKSSGRALASSLVQQMTHYDTMNPKAVRATLNTNFRRHNMSMSAARSAVKSADQKIHGNKIQQMQEIVSRCESVVQKSPGSRILIQIFADKRPTPINVDESSEGEEAVEESGENEIEMRTDAVDGIDKSFDEFCYDYGEEAEDMWDLSCDNVTSSPSVTPTSTRTTSTSTTTATSNSDLNNNQTSTSTLSSNTTSSSTPASEFEYIPRFGSIFVVPETATKIHDGTW